MDVLLAESAEDLAGTKCCPRRVDGGWAKRKLQILKQRLRLLNVASRRKRDLLRHTYMQTHVCFAAAIASAPPRSFFFVAAVTAQAAPVCGSNSLVPYQFCAEGVFWRAVCEFSWTTQRFDQG